MDIKPVPSKIIERAPVGPLSPYIESYIALVNEQGFAPPSVYEQIRVIVMFSQWLERSGCEIRDLDESVTERFLYQELKARWPHVCAPAILRRLLALLRRIGAEYLTGFSKFSKTRLLFEDEEAKRAALKQQIDLCKLKSVETYG